MADKPVCCRLLCGAFLCPLATQLFRVCDQRTIDFHPVAVVNFVMQLYRTTVDTQLVFRQIDVITQRQQTAGDNRLLDRRPLIQGDPLQILLFRQRVSDLNTNIKPAL